MKIAWSLLAVAIASVTLASTPGTSPPSPPPIVQVEAAHSVTFQRQPPSVAVWERVAQCESTSRWGLRGGRFWGGLQFTISSWRLVGGKGLPSNASKWEQIFRANRLWRIQGWGAWPSCSRKLGLR